MPRDSRRDEESEEIERLRAEIQRLRGENTQRQEELQRGHELYLRHLADFDNYRRRVEQERVSAALKGKRQLLSSLLDFQDDFERALAHLDESPASVSEGLLAISRRLASLLAAEGVIAVESVGRPFDPEQHEAVASAETDNQEPGTVIEELSRGYRWDRELLRPARVRVAR